MDKEQGDKPDPDSKEECRRFCERWLAAWSGSEPSAVVAMLSDDAVYRDPARSTGVYGKEAIAEYLDLLFVRNPEWTFTLVDCWLIEPGTIVMKRRVRNTMDNRVFEDNGVEFLEFNDRHLVTSCEMYYDRVGWRPTDL
ncbi:nuclear transport factor 2 family protein [bacterium]|nr:nuclear transport factor 2 family protein [bacterium]